MTSGIYLLKFKDETFYIGKSVNINKRWDQHYNSMSKGNHAKLLQYAYNKCGAPDGSVLQECHQDHIDILESYYINKYWSGDILNTTRPMPLSTLEIAIVESGDEVWKLSTFDHILKWSASNDKVDSCKNKIKELEKELKEVLIDHDFELDSIKKGTKLEAVEKAKDYFRDRGNKLEDELKALKNRTFLQRLFNV